MFPSLAARETFVANPILLAGRKEMLLNQVKNIFTFRPQILCRKRVFQCNHIRRNNVFATMFPSLARPFKRLLIKYNTCISSERIG